MKSTLSHITLSAAIALLLGAAPSPGVLVSYTGEGTPPNDDADGPAEDMFLSDGAQDGTFNATLSTVITPVKFGSGSYDFQDATAAMTVPGSTNLGIAFTLAAFAWSNSGGGEQAIFASYFGGPIDDTKFLLDIDPGNLTTTAMRFVHDGASYFLDAPGLNISNGAYHHYALTYDDGAVIMYVDGAAAGSANVGAGSFDLGADVTVGWSANNRLVGWMDDVLIINRALTPGDISSLSTNGNGAVIEGIVLEVDIDPGVAISWQSTVGFDYQAQFTEDLVTSNSWFDLGPTLSGTGGRQSTSDSTENALLRAYRVVETSSP
jgi:hypothetical protein